MTRYAVRAANILITQTIELVEAESPYAAIKTAQAQAKTTFLRPAAINADQLREHLNNLDSEHLNGSWYDCTKCSLLPQDKYVASNYESVDVIASGYEWTCLAERCEHLNHEIEFKEWVVCSECGRGYTTNPPDHAMG